MAMTARPQSIVFRPTLVVVLDGGIRPVIGGVPEPRMTGEPSDDDAALSRSLCDRCDTTQCPQSMVVSPLQGIPCLCEQRGEDDPAVSWHGCEDRHVALLTHLPRVGLLVGLFDRLGKARAQDLQLPMGAFELLVDEPQARNQCANVRRRSVDAPNAMVLENLLHRRLAHARRLGGRRQRLPEVEHPLGCDVRLELEHLWIVAPQLLAQAVSETVLVGGQVVGYTRPLAQLHQYGLRELDLTEGAHIGSQRVPQHLGIPTIVFGTSRREAVAEPIKLLGINGIDVKATFQKRLDDGPVRHLDRDMDHARRAAAGSDQPIAHFGQASAAMAELTLAEALAVTVHQVHVMVFRRPVDASEPLFFGHSFGHSQSPISLRATRDVDQSLYWRSKAQSSHWASKSRPPAGALVPPRCSPYETGRRGH